MYADASLNNIVGQETGTTEEADIAQEVAVEVLGAGGVNEDKKMKMSGESVRTVTELDN